MAANNSHGEAIYSVLQYLDRHNLGEAARTLERESGLFFCLPYFEECFIHGAFDEAEEYFNGFTTVHDNMYSTNVVFVLRWHKFLEAVDENNRDEAHTILHEELSTFLLYNPNLIERGTEIMNLENFRTYEGLQEYGEPVMARTSEMMDVRRCLEANPLLSGKIRYRIPNASGGRGPADLVLPPPPLPAVMPVLPPPLPAAPAASPAGQDPLPLTVLLCGPGHLMLIPRGFI
ncbi:PREDICTED: protein TPR3-like [Prunus mume]|uniref:Protein TPR3-like n=1 Tax=Prunus mume TaxID=102107 RepID=A0ABM0N563_PRUMU|nr:PREDICTED: protein TPR3-like [Prunus mume]